MPYFPPLTSIRSSGDVKLPAAVLRKASLSCAFLSPSSSPRRRPGCPYRASYTRNGPRNFTIPPRICRYVRLANSPDFGAATAQHGTGFYRGPRCLIYLIRYKNKSVPYRDGAVLPATADKHLPGGPRRNRRRPKLHFQRATLFRAHEHNFIPQSAIISRVY